MKQLRYKSIWFVFCLFCLDGFCARCTSVFVCLRVCVFIAEILPCHNSFSVKSTVRAEADNGRPHCIPRHYHHLIIEWDFRKKREKYVSSIHNFMSITHVFYDASRINTKIRQNQIQTVCAITCCNSVWNIV